jgi:hypothetical protein
MEEIKEYVLFMEEKPKPFLRVYPKGNIEFHFSRPTPFLKDGHWNEMNETLKEVGWKIGFGGFTCMEGMSARQALNLLRYAEAYQKTYEQVIAGDPYGKVNLTISQFLEEVDKNLVMESGMAKPTLNMLKHRLTEMGFSYTDRI